MAHLVTVGRWADPESPAGGVIGEAPNPASGGCGSA